MLRSTRRSFVQLAWGLSLLLAGFGPFFRPSTLPAQATQLKPEEQAALILSGANKTYNDKQYPQAADRYREYLKTFAGLKDATSARYGLALCLFEANPKDYKQATELLGQVVGVADFADRPLALYYLALAHRNLGLDALNQAAAKPNEAPQHRTTATQNFTTAAQRYGEAVTAFAQRATTAPPPAANATELPVDVEWGARCRADQADMLLRIEKPKEAAELLLPFQAMGPLAKSKYQPLATYLQGHAAFLLKDYPQAVKSLSTLAPFADPVFGLHAQYLLARTHHLADERAEAAALYEAIVTGYEKQKPVIQQTLQQQAAALQNQPEEKARLELLLRTPPDYVSRANFYWGVLLYEQGKASDALARLTTFLTQSPQSPLADEAKLRQGICQVELRQFAPAQQLLQPLAPHPVLADRALLWLARAQFGAADPAMPQPYTQAVTAAAALLTQAADKANQRIAQEPEAKARRAEILLELGDYQQLAKQFAPAATTYETGFRENLVPQRQEEFLQRRATALHLAGQFDPSDQACQQFQQQFPTSPLLPAVLFRYGENAFQRGAAIEPANPTSKNADLVKWMGETQARFKVLLDKFPEFTFASTARYRQGLAFYRLNDFAKAQERFAAIPPPEQQGELVGVAYYHADCLLRNMPTDASDALAAGKQLQVLQEAAKLLDTFIGAQGADPAKASPQTADALLKLGFCHQRTAAQIAEVNERNQKLTAARLAYERIAQQFPTSPVTPVAVLQRAECLLEANDVVGATNELNRFKADPLKNAPIAPLAWLRLGAVLRSQNKAAEAAQLLQDARAQYENALVGDPARAAWAPLLGHQHGLGLREAGKLLDAQKAFESVVQKFPGTPEAFEAAWRAGQCRREEAMQRYTAAQVALAKPGAKPEELVAPRQQLQEAVKHLAESATYLVGQAQQAAAKIAGTEVHQRLHYEAAWCYQVVADTEIEAARLKLIDEALKKLQEQKTAAAAAPNAPVTGGLQNVPQQRAPEIAASAIPVQPAEQAARDQYKALIAAKSDTPLSMLARLEYAELQSRRGEIDPALALLNDALSLEPEPAVEQRIRLRLGTCLVAKNDQAGAAQQFAAVAADPKSPLAAEARYRAGETQMQLKLWPKAIEWLLPFRDQGPFQNLPGLSDRAVLRLGHAFALASQWDQSRQTHEVLVGRYPQSVWKQEGRYGAGWAAQNQKQFDQAANFYQQVINETATEVAAKAQYQLALCRLEQKRLPEAATALLVVPFTYDYPDWSAIAILEASRVFQDMNQPQQTKRLLERVVKDYPNTEWAKTAQQRLTTLQTGGAK